MHRTHRLSWDGAVDADGHILEPSGLQSHLIPYTLYGGKLVLMYRWDADLAVDLIEREAVTNFSGVPHTAFDLLERASARRVELSGLQGLASGATLVPPELVRRVDRQFASRVAPGNGYGLTETTGAMIVNMGADYVARPDSVGKVLAPVVGVRFVGPDGLDVAPGEVGEIWISGPTIVRGYHGNPEATAAVVRRRPGSDLDAGTVRAHAAQRLAAFAVPSVVDVRNAELPRNATGKVLKRRLREELATATTRRSSPNP